MNEMSQDTAGPKARNDVLRDYVRQHLTGLAMPHWYFLHVAAVVLQTRVRRIAEIGVDKGKCAYHLRRLFFQAELHLIDPWAAYEGYSDRCVPTRDAGDRKCTLVHELFVGDHAVTIHRTMSEDAAREIPGDFDVVFIDGNHSYEYVKKDIISWRPTIRPGGFLAGHDYLNKRGVRKAVDELLPDAVMPDEKVANVWVHAE
ncbi:MAG TPA: class I SAM-dependent methyltransferase [Thermoguttaceae bacterium]|nr:class I SAM-dependent methyltransferase [Thermoguttaceae bacterium]